MMVNPPESTSTDVADFGVTAASAAKYDFSEAIDHEAKADGYFPTAAEVGIKRKPLGELSESVRQRT